MMVLNIIFPYRFRNMITTWEYNALNSGFLIIKKQALTKFLIYSKKPILMAFVGTTPDKIYFTEFIKEQYGEVYLHPLCQSLIFWRRTFQIWNASWKKMMC
jgi:hypothetical protein